MIRYVQHYHTPPPCIAKSSLLFAPEPGIIEMRHLAYCSCLYAYDYLHYVLRTQRSFILLHHTKHIQLRPHNPLELFPLHAYTLCKPEQALDVGAYMLLDAYLRS